MSFARSLRVFFRQNPFHRNLRKTRIGVIALKIGVSQLHGLDLLVQLGHAERAIGAGAEVSMMFNISSAAMPCPFGGSS